MLEEASKNASNFISSKVIELINYLAEEDDLDETLLQTNYTYCQV